MPALTSGLVLVTGASGFLGVHTSRALTDAGFRVRATVRDNAKGDYLKSILPDIEIALVPDMSSPGAYAEAVRGVDAVVHVASPLDATNTGPPENVTGPAVQGVLSIMEAAASEPRIQRIVQISSVAAVGAPGMTTAKELSEDSWNDAVVQACEKLGADAPGPAKYGASKVLAERAFWKFFETPRSFDGVALNPALLFGPPAGYPPTKVQGSNGQLVPWLTQVMPESDLKTEYWTHADVRDAAEAAVLSLKTPEAAGERFIVATGSTHGNDFAIGAERLNDPALTKGNHDPAFRASLDAEALQFSSAKLERVFGFKLRPTDETFADAAVGIKKVLDAQA